MTKTLNRTILRRVFSANLTLVLFSCLSVFAQAAQQILWYPFDDAVDTSIISDASGNGRDGSIVGGVTLDGESANFDGSSGYIHMPDHLMAGLTAITVTAEIFIKDSQASPYFIYGMGNIDGNIGSGYLFTTGNHYRTSISSCHWSCEQTVATPSENLPRGEWIQIAYTLESGIGVLYLNGEEVARNEAITLSPGDIGSGESVANFIGRSLYSGDNNFYGAVSDFQIWDGALTAEEIAAYSPQKIVSYSFDDAVDSTTVSDASGNGNDGLLIGGTTLTGDTVNLDGNSGYVKLPDNILAGLEEITVTALVYVDRNQPSPYFIYTMGNTANGIGDGYLFTTGDYYRTTISDCDWSCEQNTGTPDASLSQGEWHHLAYTLSNGVGILYLDGAETARTQNITLTPGDIGDGITAANYLGRSLYEVDHYLHGSFDEFQIWNRALSTSKISSMAAKELSDITLNDQDSVLADTSSLDIVNLDDVRGHLHLPVEGKNGTSIQWLSSNTAVISTDGIVNRAPACSESTDSEVTLQSSVLESQNSHPAFLKHNQNQQKFDRFSWLRPQLSYLVSCDTTQHVTLTALISKGQESTIKSFQATIPPLTNLDDYEGYLFTYFTGEGYADGEQVYFALSNGNDALDWQTLNNQEPVLTSTKGEKGARDPFIIRSPEGDKFFMIATDLKIYGNWDWGRSQTWGSQSLLVWESNDLVNWSDARLVEVSPDTAGNTWAPEAFWDPERQYYVVFWASKIYDDETHSNSTYNKMMYSLTRDFVNFTEASVWVDAGYSTIDSTIVKHEDLYYRFTKDERSASQSACGKFILAETSSTLNNLNWTLLKDCIGSGDISQGEGPLIFKSNSEEKWYLFIDEFGGRGYIPFESTDLSTGEWTIPANYNLPARPRHGTVLPITADELEAIQLKWGDDS